jgi:hypothetical protein
MFSREHMSSARAVKRTEMEYVNKPKAEKSGVDETQGFGVPRREFLAHQGTDLLAV